MQDDSFVVFGILCTVEQRGGTADYGLFEKSKLRGVVFQLGHVAGPKLPPFVGIMSEPFAETVAWGNLFQPQIDMGLLFREASWPEAVDEDAGAVGFRRCFVDTLELDSHG